MLFAKTAITTTAVTTVVWILVTYVTNPEPEEVLLRLLETQEEQDRRQTQRFEKDNPPRRSGQDRRKGQIDWASRGHV